MILAHCVHLSEKAITSISSSGSGISHCPNSNFALCSGVMDAGACLKQ
jgi:guanine deaminase